VRKAAEKDINRGQLKQVQSPYSQTHNQKHRSNSTLAQSTQIAHTSIYTSRRQPEQLSMTRSQDRRPSNPNQAITKKEKKQMEKQYIVKMQNASQKLKLIAAATSSSSESTTQNLKGPSFTIGSRGEQFARKNVDVSLKNDISILDQLSNTTRFCQTIEAAVTAESEP